MNYKMFKTLTEWEDKNKAKIFLLIEEEDIKDYFTSKCDYPFQSLQIAKDLENIDIYECIDDVCNAYDLHNEYQHIVDEVIERVKINLKENV